MFLVLLTTYVVIRWIGEFELLSDTVGDIFISTLCFFVMGGFILSFMSPGGLRRLAALFNPERRRYTVLISPVLWLLFFIIYPLGLVDWLVSIHILDDNRGFLFSHETPGGVDIVALILDLLLIILFPLWKFFDISFGD